MWGLDVVSGGGGAAMAVYNISLAIYNALCTSLKRF